MLVTSLPRISCDSYINVIFEGEVALGDRVRIDDIEGRIIDIMVSRVIIDTEAGRIDVPAKLFDEQVTIITEKGS